MSTFSDACCDDFASAVDGAFANPIDGPTGWILYGTDYDSVIRGSPELRYWPIGYCPFCGQPLTRLDPGRLRVPPPFGEL